MNTAARDLSEVLDRERHALVAANVDALVEIQTQKRQILDRLREHQAPADEIAPLVDAARQNVSLIRHLVQCLRGLLGEESVLYTPRGQTEPVPFGLLRGRG